MPGPVGQEWLRCFLMPRTREQAVMGCDLPHTVLFQVAMVKFGRYGEFPALLVASDLRIHMLEVTGEIR